METSSNKKEQPDTRLNEDEPLHTYIPMSEKDEVKQAEKNTGKPAPAVDEEQNTENKQ